MLTWANLWLRAMPTIDSFRLLSKLGDALYETKLQVKLGNSSDDRNTLAGVLMIIFKEITEQLPKEVGAEPSTCPQQARHQRPPEGPAPQS